MNYYKFIQKKIWSTSIVKLTYVESTILSKLLRKNQLISLKILKKAFEARVRNYYNELKKKVRCFQVKTVNEKPPW